jgi:hypothetical protein
MLDIRALGFVVPIPEQPLDSITPVVRVQNFGDESATITGLIRVYRESTGLLEFSSVLATTQLAAGATAVIAALTPYDPPAPADDDYFIIANLSAKSLIPPDWHELEFYLGAMHFDVKPGPMGPAPAAHHGTHEDAGMDEIDLTGLSGLLGDPQTPASHAQAHQDGQADEVNIDGLHGQVADNQLEYLRTDGTNPCTDYIDIVESAPPANPAADSARIYAEDSKGFTLLSFRDATGMVRKLVRDSVIIVRNVTGAPIPAMSPVYASGSSGNVPTIALARANAIGTMPAIGITLESIANNAFGRVMQLGLIENVNTNPFNEGDILFVDAAVAGALTAAAPTYPNIRQEIGTVLVKGVGNGALQIIARSMLYETIIDHAGLMNLTAGDPHTQYQLETAQLTSIITSETPQTLTDQAAIDWNLALGGAAQVTLGGDRTMNAPTNMVNGARYRLKVIQDGTGTRLLTWNAVYRFPGGVDPCLSAAINCIDLIIFDCDGTHMDCVGMVNAVA